MLAAIVLLSSRMSCETVPTVQTRRDPHELRRGVGVRIVKPPCVLRHHVVLVRNDLIPCCRDQQGHGAKFRNLEIIVQVGEALQRQDLK